MPAANAICTAAIPRRASAMHENCLSCQCSGLVEQRKAGGGVRNAERGTLFETDVFRQRMDLVFAAEAISAYVPEMAPDVYTLSPFLNLVTRRLPLPLFLPRLPRSVWKVRFSGITPERM